MKNEDIAIIFKALSDPRRVRIVKLLQGGEKCACELIEKMDMPQSTLSYHMKVLCRSGIVKAREEGKWTYYRVCPTGSKRAIEIIQKITAKPKK
jgi:ArsR family transcriptional regulator